MRVCACECVSFLSRGAVIDQSMHCLTKTMDFFVGQCVNVPVDKVAHLYTILISQTLSCDAIVVRTHLAMCHRLRSCTNYSKPLKHIVKCVGVGFGHRRVCSTPVAAQEPHQEIGVGPDRKSIQNLNNVVSVVEATLRVGSLVWPFSAT